MKKLQTKTTIENKQTSNIVGAGFHPCPKQKNINNPTPNVPTSNIKPLTSNVGITLVALVITIIVLLILAGVTLNMVMGDSGIFSKANIASEKTKQSQALEDIKLKILECKAEGNGTASLKDLVQKLSESEETYLVTRESQVASLAEGSIAVADAESANKIYVTNTAYGYEVEVSEDLKATLAGINETVPGGSESGTSGGSGASGSDTKNGTIEDGDFRDKVGKPGETINGEVASYSNPIIPYGFRAIDNSIDDTISADASWLNGEGYKYGLVIEDQEGNQFVWIAVDGTNVALNRYQFEDNLNWNSESYTKYSEILDSTWAQRVETYGGYYIGRYETQYANNKCVIKKGNVPTSNVSKDTAQEYAKGMGASYGYTTVTADLLNSYMWDTALKYIDYYTNSSFSTTTGLGNSSAEGNGAAVSSGSYSNDIKCNIADMSGNVREWTTEYYSSSSPCVERGSSYVNSFAACRRCCEGIGGMINVGFRCALYW